MDRQPAAWRWEEAGYSQYQAAEGGPVLRGQLEAMLAADNRRTLSCARPPGLSGVEDVMAEVHGVAGIRTCEYGRFSYCVC